MIEKDYYNDEREKLSAWSDRMKYQYMALTFCDNFSFVDGFNFTSRQVVQQGAYLVFPNTRTGKSRRNLSPCIAKINKDHHLIKCEFIVPAGKKESIIKELKKVGIDESTLFFDNVDVVCKNIKKDIENGD